MTKPDSKNPDPVTGFDADLVRTLADVLNESGLTEIEYDSGELHVRLAKTPAAAAPVSAAAPAAAPAPEPEPEPAPEAPVNHPGVITSPMVGVVYLASEPGADPFVRVGDMVNEGQTVLIIEAMKMFNQIKAVRGGKVTRIFIGNGTPVEFGEPLLIIE